MEIRRSGHSRVRQPASRHRASSVDRSVEGASAPIGDQNSIAIVGLACRYPDADDAAAFFHVILCRRRAFRRIPLCRMESAPDAAYSTRAALIEGWRFDRAAFGISQASYVSADPAQWLAIETTARALAAAGFAGGAGLPGERTGVYVATGPLAGVRPGSIAASMCGQFGFGGGGFSIDAGAASSLAAVASACSALAAGELDAAVAGGVDVSIDPLELTSLAEAGVLASGDMRIYDQKPTGFLPGEGCGIVLLMRTADAAAADLPVYAEILGYGMASAGQQQRYRADPGGMLSALRRAYETARIDPADVQLVEGCGTGVGHADEAELTALATLRSGSRRPAGIGAVTANIGNTGAAAGAAGLIKAVLATANGVLPPTVGVATPHQILGDAGAGLRLLPAAEAWPAGHRHAGVSARSLDGLSAHIVLRGQPVPNGRCSFRAPAVRARIDQPSAFLVHAPDRAALTGVLSRIADMARWLSDAQLHDLACQLAVEAADQSRVKVAIVASRQEQLARLAGEAITMLPALTGRMVSTRPGIFAADGADGQVTVLLASQDAAPAESAQHQLDRALAVLARLDELGVKPIAAVGHGLGELAALVCAGSISAAHARALTYLRTDALAASTTAAPGNLSSAIDGFAGFGFGTPLCRLVSGCTGDELSIPDEIASSLTAELLDARSAADQTVTAIPAGQRLAAAVRIGARGASLLLQSGRDRDLTRAVSRLDPTRPGAGLRRKIPVAVIDGDPADDGPMASAAAALFAAGALTKASLLYAGHQARPIDIWRDPVFITRPSQPPPSKPTPPPRAGAAGGSGGSGRGAATPGGIGGSPPRASSGGAAWTDERSLRGGKAAPKSAPTPGAGGSGGSPPGRQSGGSPPWATTLTGVAPWYRCYAERHTEPVGLITAPACGPWRVYTGGCDALRNDVVELFTHDPSAGRTVAVLGRPHDAGAVEAALLAAQDAIGTGRLLAVSAHAGWSGLWAALHAEHPKTSITTVRAELDQAGLRGAVRIGAAPGEYRELTIEADGAVRELVMAPVETEHSGSFPLGDGDVALISRGAGAAGLALAQVLACCGAAVAFVGRDHPGRDDAVIAELERLRQAGAPITYEIVNPSSAAALDAAVRRIERRLGPVTAVAHAVRPTPPRAIACLRPADLRTHVASEARLLDHLVTAVRAGDHALRFVVTFGSVTGKYGLGEAAMAALAAGMIADQGERLADAGAGCRALHIDWPAAMPAADGSRLLLGVLGAAAELPGRLAVHGRVGLRAPRPVALAAAADPALTGRFTERVLVHYPGAELIAEATLDTTTDPYLTDYTVDGASVLPPAIAIEAMAQAASALAGAPARSLTDVSMAAPIVLSGQRPTAVIRLCALAAGDAVTVILRCESTGYAVDHFRGTFRREAAPPCRVTSPAADATSGSIKAGELYGPVCFQAGRFKRLTTVRFAGSKAATGTLDTAEEPWFAAIQPRQLVIGSPALTDAALQVAQACVPHRRLTFSGLASATFAGQPATGVVQLHATQVSGKTPRAEGRGGERENTAPGLHDETTGPRESVWDVDAIDGGGELVACVRGLAMRDAGPLRRTSPWPAALAACFVERAAAELGLGPDLEVRLDRRPTTLSQRNADGWVRAPASDAGPPGLVLRVRASGPVACGWRTAKQAGRIRGGTPEGAARWLEVLDDQPAWGTGAATGTNWARAMAIASCAGPAASPGEASVEVRQVAGTNWLLVRADSASMACAVIELAGAGHPVAIAVRTGVFKRALAALGSS